MSLPIDYIFMNSCDKGVVIINILSSSRISIEFMMRNTILALDELYYRRPLYCLLTNTSLFMFCVLPWVPCYPAIVLLYLGVLPSFMSTMSWEFHHLLRILDIVILLAISIHILVPVLFPTEKQTNGLWCVKFKISSNPISLTLMVDSFILSLLLIESSFKHWSCFQISGCPLLSLLNCVCFPRAYIIISFDLTNVISLFTWLWKPIFLGISRNGRWVH